jgi:dihydroorotate dehydrogenase electron transfer subunit
MSIMRADPKAGWIDILYKIHGSGTALLAERKLHDRLSLIGPIGVPFKQGDYRRRPLLLGGGVGIPPMVFLAEHMKALKIAAMPLVLMGSEVPFPFRPRPSQILVPGLPPEVIAAMPLLDDWGIPSRLTSLKGFPGGFEGYVTDLARAWLDPLHPAERAEVEVFACGPTSMLKAVATLAQEYRLPCQISLEEYMACAVGGCAGCVVQVLAEQGPAMKRVCVDGPVFEAASVVFQ